MFSPVAFRGFVNPLVCGTDESLQPFFAAGEFGNSFETVRNGGLKPSNERSPQNSRFAGFGVAELFSGAGQFQSVRQSSTCSFSIGRMSFGLSHNAFLCAKSAAIVGSNKGVWLCLAA